MAYYRENYTFSDAVETLTALAEIEGWEDPWDLHIDEGAIPEEDKGARERAIDWLQTQDGDATVSVIRRLFHVIHEHLEGFAAGGAFARSQRANRRRVRGLMVVVGEAAQKLDHFIHLFHGAHEGAITSLEEYRELQRFYLGNLASEVQTAELEEELGLAPQEEVESELDRIKSDKSYELLYLCGQDGVPYITAGLEQTVKLACDFHMEMEEYHGRDPLIYLQDWKDHLSQLRAAEIARRTREAINGFLVANYAAPPEEHTALLNKAILALRMAANPRNMIRHHAAKACYSYLKDFINYLRELLDSRSYGERITSRARGTDRRGQETVVLVDELCYQLYASAVAYDELEEVIEELIHEGKQALGYQKPTSVSQRLAESYLAAEKILKAHPNGPLFKALDLIRERPPESFDPMGMGNYPDPLFSLNASSYQTTVLRLPTPTQQTRVDQAQLAPEFLGFLRALKHKKQRMLLINGQDRTSWRELARAELLESLPGRHHLDEVLVTVSIPKDTDFYYQRAFFHNEDRWSVFSGLLRSELERNEKGYFFPGDLREELMGEFFDAALGAVRRLFFRGASDLSRSERRDFLEIFQLLLELKLIDLLQPDFCAYVSKDAVDTVPANTARLFIGLKLFHGESLNDEDWKLITQQLFAPAFLERERLMMGERWERFLSAVHRLEYGVKQLAKQGRTQQIQEELGPLFESNILGAKPEPPETTPYMGAVIL